MSSQQWSRSIPVVLGAVVPRPWLWWSALSAVLRLSRRGWWHRTPFLPVPGEAYWHFRMVTAFGGSGEGGALSGEDVVAYLQWCRRTRPHRG
ncbi:MAG TPA: hypothetical protein VHV57_02165 [Acidimicrobiales bacterium]|nr:hypothetical protein [Acidimicrobiales bacterium]